MAKSQDEEEARQEEAKTLEGVMPCVIIDKASKLFITIFFILYSFFRRLKYIFYMEQTYSRCII